VYPPPNPHAIRKHVIKTINRSRGDSVVDTLTFHTVIPVPAIWKGYARQEVEEAACERLALQLVERETRRYISESCLARNCSRHSSQGEENQMGRIKQKLAIYTPANRRAAWKDRCGRFDAREGWAHAKVGRKASVSHSNTKGREIEAMNGNKQRMKSFLVTKRLILGGSLVGLDTLRGEGVHMPRVRYRTVGRKVLRL
jgi:hypothetical protein